MEEDEDEAAGRMGLSAARAATAGHDPCAKRERPLDGWYLRCSTLLLPVRETEQLQTSIEYEIPDASAVCRPRRAAVKLANPVPGQRRAMAVDATVAKEQDATRPSH